MTHTTENQAKKGSTGTGNLLAGTESKIEGSAESLADVCSFVFTPISHLTSSIGTFWALTNRKSATYCLARLLSRRITSPSPSKPMSPRSMYRLRKDVAAQRQAVRTRIIAVPTRIQSLPRPEAA
ncbi:hypothetical protein BC834DRAFT_1033093 [Gloeopeniophorella convolvens]|nr:hypothetical protein BC834DRAFT_1033093 [Gloeopeniophorella convolvens]